MLYKYKARTIEGKLQKGMIEASSKSAALHTLEKYGFYVTSLKEVSGRGFLNKEISLRKISTKDVVFFTRQLAVMLKSAISPVDALRSQVIQIENPDFREKILTIAEMVEGGSSLSEAFASFPQVFNQFYISVIKSGETTGKLSESLEYLARHLEREYNLNRKIKNAMIYPAFVVVVFIAVFFLATFFIVPKLKDILSTFKGKLPWTTKLTISLSESVRKGGWTAIIPVFLLLVLGAKYARNSPEFRKFYDHMILKVPLIGDFYKKIYLSRFAENFSVLIAAGLPITQALKITGEIIENSVYKKIIEQAKEGIARGEKISAVLNHYPEQIPSFVLRMIATGEEAGRLDETLMEVVKFYQQEIDRTIEQLPNFIEPVLIIFLGVSVAILAISIFIPLFKIGMEGFGGM